MRLWLAQEPSFEGSWSSALGRSGGGPGQDPEPGADDGVLVLGKEAPPCGLWSNRMWSIARIAGALAESAA